MSIKLKLPRIITATTEPLTFDQIEKVAPAVFNRAPGVNTLSKYKPIPTVEAIQLLQHEGYVITQAAQARSEHRIFDQEAKHVVRMRHESFFGAPAKVGEEVPELILINAHDASSKFFIMMGLYRFICTNGLMAGETLETYQLRHVGPDLDTQMRVMLEQMTTKSLPLLTSQVRRMKERQLNPHEQTVFAARALNLRWPEGTDAVTTENLLKIRRPEDAANDVWHVLNRVQENILQGGFYAHNTTRRVRPLEQVGAVVAVNRGLWDMAMRIAA